MADINHVTLIGRLTRDCELKYTSGGMAISSFAIAVNRRRKKGDQWVEEASFFDINLFGKSAESLKQYLVKGKQIAVGGYLDQQRWEKDGQNYSKVVIVADSIQLLGGNENGQQYAPQAQHPAGEYQSAGSGYDFPEDIPF